MGHFLGHFLGPFGGPLGEPLGPHLGPSFGFTFGSLFFDIVNVSCRNGLRIATARRVIANTPLCTHLTPTVSRHHKSRWFGKNENKNSNFWSAIWVLNFFDVIFLASKK